MIRIDTFYRPVPPEKGAGEFPVYSQHLNYFNSSSRRTCLRKGFLQYGKEEIEKRNREGDIILLMGDFNEYILSPKSHLFFSKLGLIELIADKNGTKGPGTTIPNKKNKAIEGICASPRMSKKSYSYLTINHGLK